MSWWKNLFSRPAAAPTETRATEPAGKTELNLRTGTAEFEAFIAYHEIDHGESLAHGAEHLANLLGYDPANPAWLALAERYAERAGQDADTHLLPLGEKLYASTEALRAWLWARDGRLVDAVERLLQAQQAMPGPNWLDAWVPGWLEPADALESLPADLQVRLFGQVISRTPEARLNHLRRLHDVQRWARLSARVTPSDDFRAQWPMLRIGLLRRAGAFDEALQLCAAADSDWHLAVARGLLLRQMQRAEDADAAFRQAVTLRPDDPSAYLEAADTWLDANGWAQALDWYAAVLERHPEHPWALPSSLYAQWRMTADEALIEHLVQLTNADNGRAGELWQRARGGLPEPQDASANILRQLHAQYRASSEAAPGGAIRIRVSSLEAPSNALALDLELRALGALDCQIEISAEHIPSPDPRQSAAPITTPLWRYDGDNASPALAAPPAAIAQAIAELAGQPYAPQANWAAASRVAAGLDAEAIRQVFACMVQPPAIPTPRAADGTPTALGWLPRVQLCALQVIAQWQDDWTDSLRRELLYSALLGPSDWATVAALRALTWVALSEPAHAWDIHQHFERLDAYRPDSGYCCWEGVLLQCWQQLPLLGEQEREALQARLQALHPADDEAAE
ncbi:MAG: hypothetical protein GAK43_00968 [Stenotrophomonas maltophilia]|nr:MAG: hypothetical protein GAK43_00968 [Stenotrophomonas maltophilia]